MDLVLLHGIYKPLLVVEKVAYMHQRTIDTLYVINYTVACNMLNSNDYNNRIIATY